MTRSIISITSKDRSGIIAGISEGIFRLSGNIEAASQTVHRGYFAMIVLASFDAAPDEREISQSIRESAGADLHVFTTNYEPGEPRPETDGSNFVVTCVGPDRPGILRSLTRFLASRDVNVDDLYCTVEATDFVVICQVTIPEGTELLALQADLDRVAARGGYVSTLQHENIFEETNRP